MRNPIKEADPDVVEEWKWMGTPVWSHDGIISTGESYFVPGLVRQPQNISRLLACSTWTA